MNRRYRLAPKRRIAGSGQRSTPAGEHRAVLLNEIVESFSPPPGAIVVDCTIGWAGHGVDLLKRVGPTGRLIGIDRDADNLIHARERLQAVGFPFSLHHSNFAAVAAILCEENVNAVDFLLADLGMSSMQVDDPERGFSYVRDGPLDMRMDRTRGRTAAQILATISAAELRQALHEWGDEPDAERIAAAIVASRQLHALERTSDLSRLILDLAHPKQGWKLHPTRNRWNLHPAARTFQALRILVNRELASLEELLRVLPRLMRPGGKAAIISFHSGEDRIVKTAFRDGLRAGIYRSIAPDPIRAGSAERETNPRARSAKLRLAERA